VSSVKSCVRSRPQVVLGLVAVLAVVIAFAAGFVVADESDKVSELEDQVASTKSELSDEEQELAVAEEEREEVGEEAEDAEEELAAERGFKGTGGKQVADQEYETDYPWEAAGEVGYLTMKPIAWEEQGEKWILTVEAKNTGSEPEEPFCGSAGATVVDADDNNYSGEAVLGGGSANCGSALQPGQTATYKGEFQIPSNAVPVIVALYGDYEQEEEAKQWELPH
jgi:hypothetical protein